MPSVTFTTRGALRKSALRLANERLVLNAIRQNPGISRPDLSRLTGLSASSISFIVNRLKREKLLVEEELRNYSQVGRRPTSMRLLENTRLALAVEVDLAGTHVALVNLGGRVLQRRSAPWQANHEILARKINATIQSMLGQHEPDQVLGIGVGLQGTIDRSSGRIIAAESLTWFNVEFGGLLKGHINLPFYFENNAKVSALAERWFTVPGQSPLHDFVFITPTGGLGTGIVSNGNLLQGASGMAGEFGHVVLYPDGRKCPCGNRGCLERYTSDEALCRVYAEERGGLDSGVPRASEIVRLARAGDPAALKALTQAAHDLGLGIVGLTWVFNPEAVVLGGYLAEGWDLIEHTVWEVLRGRAPHYLLAGLRIYPSRHASDSVLLGAASLVFSQYFTRFEHHEAVGASRSVLMHAN